MDNRTSKKVMLLKNIIGFLTALVLFITVTYAAGENIPGKIEGYFFPVTKSVKFWTEKHYHNSSEIHYAPALILANGVMEKKRDCQFISMEVVIFDNLGNSAVVEVDNLEGTKIRDVGFHLYGPWIIRAPFDDTIIRNLHVHIYVTHRCHIFWKTVSPFLE